uniref:Uncharacterized protein n=1 Tax=Caenorhabditis japonica TaxID=281687 RepID=A0A8R1IRL9_CAEJA
GPHHVKTPEAGQPLRPPPPFEPLRHAVLADFVVISD